MDQNRSQKTLPILVFPLIWRWTSPVHALFSDSELARLTPCSLHDAVELYDAFYRFKQCKGLDELLLSDVCGTSADVPTLEGRNWLRTRAPILSEQVIVSWDRETALHTSWDLFSDRWDDFCYPLSDDVLVIPESRSWILRFHHEEFFCFGKHIS